MNDLVTAQNEKSFFLAALQAADPDVVKQRTAAAVGAQVGDRG